MFIRAKRNDAANIKYIDFLLSVIQIIGSKTNFLIFLCILNSPYLSIIIPVYNSENSLVELIDRIRNFCIQENVTYEIIAVNDGSKDQSLTVLKSLCVDNSQIKLIDLSCNSGQQAATLCGLLHSNGTYAVTIDDDLEYNPEDIHTLLFAIEKTNIKLIYGYAEKKGRNEVVNSIAKLAKYLVYGFCGLSTKLSSFRIVRQECLQNLSITNSNSFIVDGLMRKYISPNSYLVVGQNTRKYGTSNYGFFSLVKIWFQFLFSASKIGELIALILLALNIVLILKGILFGALIVILIALIVLVLTFKIKWRQKQSFDIKEKVNFN